jgi:hypothetical protein
MKITTLVCLAATTTAGCAKTDSDDLLTSGIYAAISAEANGDGVTHVRATLYVGTPNNLNFVDLTGDDRLVASFGAQEIVMSETILLNIVSHHAQFNTDNAGDQFQVAFERVVDRGAPNSIATMPDKFTIDAPPTSASRAQPLTLTWSGIDATTPMRWEATGECIDRVGTTLTADTGSLSIPANTFVKKMAAGTLDECVVTITITRGKLGQLDPNYGKGGTVEGQQVRKVMLTSQP